MLIPTLHTERLTLRAPGPEDFPAYRDFYADAEASALYGGPLTPALAWRKLAADIGHWSLRGFGVWALVDGAGMTLGGCGVVWPEGWPRHELTWWIAASARRQGYALEASRAAIAWAYDTREWPRVETHMDDRNHPAIGLVERLGGEVVAREAFPDGITRNVYALPRPQGGAAA